MTKEISARDVAKQLFALCETIEDIGDLAGDSQEQERFKSGQRFAAKKIRAAIGTWLTDEESKRKPVPHITTAAELRWQAKNDPSCVGAFARARPGRK